MTDTSLPDWDGEHESFNPNSAFDKCNMECGRIRQYQVTIISNENLSVKEKLEALEESRKLEKIILEIADETRSDDDINTLIDNRLSFMLFDPSTWGRPLTHTQKIQSQIKKLQAYIFCLIVLLIAVCFVLAIAIHDDIQCQST